MNDGNIDTSNMERIVVHNDIPGLEKDRAYFVGQSHPDVNGNWGGYRVWIVHYVGDDTDLCPTVMYVAIGEYWSVGSWPDDPNDHSRFGVVRWITDLMEKGVSPDDIWDSVEDGLVARGVGNREFRLNESSGEEDDVPTAKE